MEFYNLIVITLYSQVLLILFYLYKEIYDVYASPVILVKLLYSLPIPVVV